MYQHYANKRVPLNSEVSSHQSSPWPRKDASTGSAPGTPAALSAPLLPPTSSFPDHKRDFPSRLGNYLHDHQAHWHRWREVVLTVSSHQIIGVDICYRAKLTRALTELLSKAQLELQTQARQYPCPADWS
jgi:hypothetical protein